MLYCGRGVAFFPQPQAVARDIGDGLNSVTLVATIKSVQLATSVGVVILFWLIYPGVMAMFATAVGMVYVGASIGAIFNFRIAIWFGLLFSILTAILSTLGVSQFVRHGFNFGAGNFDGLSGIYFPPYVFLILSLASTLLGLLHVVSWRWTLSGSQQAA